MQKHKNAFPLHAIKVVVNFVRYNMVRLEERRSVFASPRKICQILENRRFQGVSFASVRKICTIPEKFTLQRCVSFYFYYYLQFVSRVIGYTLYIFGLYMFQVKSNQNTFMYSHVYDTTIVRKL